MIDLDKIFDSPLDPDLASKTNSSSQFDDASKERGDTFKGILENSLRSELPAKNGKVSPNHNMNDLDKQYRSLGGGTELILVGNDPSNESIQEFAVLQGIDPATMALIIDPSETMEASARSSEVSDLPDNENHISEFVLEESSQSVLMGEDTQLSSFQLVSDSKINNPSSVENSFATAEKLNLFSDTKNTKTAQIANLATTLKISLQGDNVKKDSVLNTNQNKKVTLSNLKVGTTEGVINNFSLPQSSKKIEMINLGGEIEEILSQVKPQGAASQTPISGTKNTETAQTANLATTLKISLQGDNVKKDSVLNTNQNKKVTLSNLKVTTTEGVINNLSLPQSSKKIEMINLGGEIEEILSQVKPQGVASQTPNFQSILRGDNSVAPTLNLVSDTRPDLSFKSGIELETNIDHEQLIRRQEQYLDASRRLAAALGERLTAQISKGAWRVEMELHPKSLGRIEIQLEMRNGDLEAYFNPSQNTTRDLLLESFSKLRDVLTEHGIDSAYIGLGSGKKQDSDGKPTESIATLDDRDESEFDSNTSMATSPNQTIMSDGLDIKV